MKISSDAGALCSSNKFGTHTFTKSILTALSLYDKSNSYTGYLYKRATELPAGDNLKFKTLRPSLAWMSVRVSAEEMLNAKDIYLGLSQAIPWLTKAKIISFLHGLSFFLHKEQYPDQYEALKDQVMFATTRSQKIIVSSQKVKQELEEHFGYSEAVVIPFGVPFDIGTGKSSKPKRPYFLFVGVNHKIKNVDFLVKAFKVFKEKEQYKDFELVLVGDHRAFVDEELGIRCVNSDRTELAGLYKNATGYLTASLYESFNFPVLEALSQNCKVVGLSSAIIPELLPYVTTANELEEFVDAMHKAIQQKKNMSSAAINEKFSWEKYVNKLTSLY